MNMKPNPELATLVNSTIKSFSQRFGREPAWVAAAPGRVNLIGDHVDYNGGFVLPFAIEKYSIVAGAPNDSSATNSTVFSQQMGEAFEFDVNSALAPAQSGWREYVKGVVFGFRSLGIEIAPMQILIDSRVPTGSGLSSSAALEVSIATMLESACGQRLEKQQKALLCQKAENDFANVPCGLMDQFISVFGMKDHVLLLDCGDLSFRQIPFEQSEVALLVVNSNASHSLGDSQYSVRRQRCQSACKALGVQCLSNLNVNQLQESREDLNPLEFRRARHVVSENERTLAFADHLKNKEWTLAGQLMYQSHNSLRDDYEVSCQELDLLVQLANEVGLKGGVYGSRMTGGGFGGSTVSLVKSDFVDEISRIIVGRFNSNTQTTTTATAFYTRPAAGAQIINVHTGLSSF